MPKVFPLEQFKLHRYMAMDWTYLLKREPEGGWFIRVYELPGCMSQGDTPDEALASIRDAMRLWFESAISGNYLIPTPKETR